MPDSTPPVLAALERAARQHSPPYMVVDYADARLLRELRDALANQPLIACSERNAENGLWVSTENGCGWCSGCRLSAMLENEDS